MQGISQVEAAPHVQGQRVVPAIARHNADSIGPALYIVRNIVYRIQNLFTVICPSRVKHMVSYFFTVQVRFVITKPGNVKPGRLYFFLCFKGFAEQGQRVVLIKIFFPFRLVAATAYPFCLPVCRLQHGRFKPGSICPGRRQAFRIKYPHPPIIACKRFKGRAAVFYIDVLRGFNGAGFPCTCRQVFYFRKVIAHHYFVSCLFLVALACNKLPA